MRSQFSGRFRDSRFYSRACTAIFTRARLHVDRSFYFERLYLHGKKIWHVTSGLCFLLDILISCMVHFGLKIFHIVLQFLPAISIYINKDTNERTWGVVLVIMN